MGIQINFPLTSISSEKFKYCLFNTQVSDDK